MDNYCLCGHAATNHEYLTENKVCWKCTCPGFSLDNLRYLEKLDDEMPNEVNKICKNCKQLRAKHEDWIATGEFAENVVCPTDDVDAEGRYKTLSWFEPMTNLEYLEYLDKANES